MSDANDGATQPDTPLVVETHSMEAENVIAEHDNDNGDCDAKSTRGDKRSKAKDDDRHTEKPHSGSSPLDLTKESQDWKRKKQNFGKGQVGIGSFFTDVKIQAPLNGGQKQQMGQSDCCGDFPKYEKKKTREKWTGADEH